MEYRVKFNCPWFARRIRRTGDFLRISSATLWQVRVRRPWSRNCFCRKLRKCGWRTLGPRRIRSIIDSGKLIFPNSLRFSPDRKIARLTNRYFFVNTIYKTEQRGINSTRLLSLQRSLADMLWRSDLQLLLDFLGNVCSIHKFVITYRDVAKGLLRYLEYFLAPNSVLLQHFRLNCRQNVPGLHENFKIYYWQCEIWKSNTEKV